MRVAVPVAERDVDFDGASVGDRETDLDLTSLPDGVCVGVGGGGSVIVSVGVSITVSVSVSVSVSVFASVKLLLDVSDEERSVVPDREGENRDSVLVYVRLSVFVIVRDSVSVTTLVKDSVNVSVMVALSVSDVLKLRVAVTLTSSVRDALDTVPEKVLLADCCCDSDDECGAVGLAVAESVGIVVRVGVVLRDAVTDRDGSCDPVLSVRVIVCDGVELPDCETVTLGVWVSRYVMVVVASLVGVRVEVAC